MAKPIFEISDHLPEYRLVKFVIPGGVTSPKEFAESVTEIATELPGPRVALVSGRGPIWGYGLILHAAHPTQAVGVFDPRLGDEGGYVVVQSHSASLQEGEVIPDPDPQWTAR